MLLENPCKKMPITPDILAESVLNTFVSFVVIGILQHTVDILMRDDNLVLAKKSEH